MHATSELAVKPQVQGRLERSAKVSLQANITFALCFQVVDKFVTEFFDQNPISQVKY